MFSFIMDFFSGPTNVVQAIYPLRKVQNNLKVIRKRLKTESTRKNNEISRLTKETTAHDLESARAEELINRLSTLLD